MVLFLDTSIPMSEYPQEGEVKVLSHSTWTPTPPIDTWKIM